MKFKFKDQQYQLDAVQAVVDVFKGQSFHKLTPYTRDLGGLSPVDGQTTLNLGKDNAQDWNVVNASDEEDDDFATGYANAPIEIDDKTALQNIRNIQMKSNLMVDDKLSKVLSPLDIDIEMETGTGKTYVYIRTMFELNKIYGFSKFIVLVPSIAIREGVKKSFEQTEDHFMGIYGKKARYFIYDGNHLNQVDYFARDNAIEVMIINIQAFNSNKGSNVLKIKKQLEAFNYRKPIDVIKKTRPILVIDEPQKMTGEATKKAIPEFNPLFTLNYSATHKERHNLVYVLDALDAYNQKLVKKIEVKAVKMDKVKGVDAFLYLDQILLRGGKDPQAKIGFLKNTDKGLKVCTQVFNRGDNIYDESGSNVSMLYPAYKNNYIIDEIDANTDTIKLVNGIALHSGEAIGDDTENMIRRIQINETIASHLEKEQKNFHKGIKTLSLFFIDEVKKYRDYDAPDQKGDYAKWFEEAYENAVLDFCNDLTNTDEEYKKYLNQFTKEKVHKGYFSVDKKNHYIDTKADKYSGAGEKEGSDEAAYDLIMKDKERLLSFEEPTRFIFSHSALSEGWDNPNVFQICTLRHTKSAIKKRQEVGRGLRIAVDKEGNRQDSTLVSDFADVNTLTVIANEDYDEFVRALQSEIKEVLYKRPNKADKDFFVGKPVQNSVTKAEEQITEAQARLIYQYLVRSGYVDENDNLTEQFRTDYESNKTVSMPDALQPYAESILALADSIHESGSIVITSAKKPKIVENKLNKNFEMKEFQELWNAINHKYTYRVAFDSNELIRNASDKINKELVVSKMTYTIDVGKQKDTINRDEVDKSFEHGTNSTTRKVYNGANNSSVKYDLVSEIAKRTHLMRKTIVQILKNTKGQLQQYRDNPEEFIAKVSNFINEEKSTVIVQHVSYNQLSDTFSNDIFTERHANFDPSKLAPNKKSIQDYVFVDGTAKDGLSNEMKFAQGLDSDKNVKVYAKMPKAFYIPTPMGKYSPDWAIVYESDEKEGVYFIAETKGSLSSLSLRKIEESKINCAKTLYNHKGSKVNYNQVHTIDDFHADVGKIIQKIKEMN